MKLVELEDQWKDWMMVMVAVEEEQVEALDEKEMEETANCWSFLWRTAVRDFDTGF